MTDQIFISYRRDDAAYVTGHINDLLRKEFGDDAVFTDVDNIALGVDFRAVLDETVSQCQVLLAVIGPNWISVLGHDDRRRLLDPADYVRIEIESALQRNIPVIPLLVAGAEMPAAEDLPESLQGLAFRNGTKIRPAPDFGVDMARLIKNLQQHFDPTQEGQLENEHPPADVEAQEDAPSKRSAAPGISVKVGEDERVRRAELGLGRDEPKKRWVARLRLTVVVLVVGAALYYVGRNQEALQELLPTDVAAVDVTDDVIDEVADDAEFLTELELEPIEEPVAEAEPEPVEVAELVDEVEVEDAPVSTAEATAEPAPEAVIDPEPDADTPEDVAEVVDVVEPERQPEPSEFIGEGVRLAAIGEHEGAIENFDEAIQLDPEQAFVYKQRGASYQALGQYEAAIKDYDEAIRLNAEDLNAYFKRGVSNHALQNYEAAIADFDVVIELDSGFIEAYSRRADAHDALGNTAAAERDREDAAEF